jgi:hypothetical protein
MCSCVLEKSADQNVDVRMWLRKRKQDEQEM